MQRHGRHAHGRAAKARGDGAAMAHGRGHQGRGRGRMRRGDIRTAVLAVLSEEPGHGYDVIQRLEDKTEGSWRPSPGSVYPMLQLLADEGLARRSSVTASARLRAHRRRPRRDPTADRGRRRHAVGAGEPAPTRTSASCGTTPGSCSWPPARWPRRDGPSRSSARSRSCATHASSSTASSPRTDPATRDNRGRERRPIRRIRPRAVLRVPLRLLRLRDVDRPCPPDRRLRRRVRASTSSDARPAPARRACSSAGGRRRCSTPAQLARILDAITADAGAEVTVECNPDSVDRAEFDGVRDGGRRTGCRSACSRCAPHVLASLGRTHDPANVEPGGRLGARGRLRRASTST